MRSVRHIRSIRPEWAWKHVAGGEAQLLDLRTELERRRYGWPPGVRRVSLIRHIAWPGAANTIYLCQHANRSKLTGWRGAGEVAGGWAAWQAARLPIERFGAHSEIHCRKTIRLDLQPSSASHCRARDRLHGRAVLLALRLRSDCGLFTTLPDNMHDEHKEFLARHLGIVEAPAAQP